MNIFLPANDNANKFFCRQSASTVWLAFLKVIAGLPKPIAIQDAPIQHKLAGVTSIGRQVIGKLDADAPLSCHDPHFNWRRARRKAIPQTTTSVPW